MTKWARYASEAQPGDLSLDDLKIVEDAHYETRMIMGYDASTNSIISSFRGSANLMNWLLNIDFVKIDYTVGGCVDC